MIIRFFAWLFGFHLHTWDSWQDPTIDSEVQPQGDTWSTKAFQRRQCRTCLSIQQRTVGPATNEDLTS